MIVAVICLVQREFDEALNIMFDDENSVHWLNMEELQVVLTMEHFNPTNVSIMVCLQYKNNNTVLGTNSFHVTPPHGVQIFQA